MNSTSRARLRSKDYHQVKAQAQLPSESLRKALNQACYIMQFWKARYKRNRLAFVIDRHTSGGGT